MFLCVQHNERLCLGGTGAAPSPNVSSSFALTLSPGPLAPALPDIRCTADGRYRVTFATLVEGMHTIVVKVGRARRIFVLPGPCPLMRVLQRRGCNRNIGRESTFGTESSPHGQEIIA